MSISSLSAAKKIILIFTIWRIYLFLVAFLGGVFFSFSPHFPYSEQLLVPSGLPPFLWKFANFDGVHYITIAQKGYWAQFTQVFFPLFPVLVGKIAAYTHTPVVFSGLIITNLLCLIFLFAFYRLVNLDFSKDKTLLSLLFILFFPTSFFLGSYYTESLFLLLVVASFYASRSKNWLSAGIFGLLASATRFVGIFLLPALLYEAWSQKEITAKKTNKQVLWLFIIPLGLIAYMFYLYWFFHDPIYFWHAQPVFGAERSGSGIVFPVQVIYRYLKIFITVSYTEYNFWVAFWELASFLSVCIFLIAAFKKNIRRSYLIFSWLAILLPSFTGTFSSMPRYVLVAFPVFIYLGLLKNKYLKFALASAFFCLLTIFTFLFTLGFWVS